MNLCIVRRKARCCEGSFALKILIVGCGGIGGFLGARLAHAGYDVHFVARGATLAALRDTGLSLRSPFGDLLISRIQASDNATTLADADVVFNCVKLWDDDSAFAAISHVVSAHTAIVSFQNGVRAVESIAARFGPSSVIGGACYVSAQVENPGCVFHSGRLQRFIIGELNGAESGRVVAIGNALTQAGLDTQVSRDIRKNIWEKFVFLVALSGATTAMRSSIGPIRQDYYARAFLYGLLQEATAIARVRSIGLDPDFADRQMEFMDTLPPEMTSSMYADLLNHKPLELRWLSEDIANLGLELNVPTPLNAAVRDVLSLYRAGEQ